MKPQDNEGQSLLTEKAKIELAQEISTFIYLTFQHSQGSSISQSTIFELCKNDRYKAVVDDLALRDLIFDSLYQMANSHLKSGKQHSTQHDDVIQSTCLVEVTSFTNAMRDLPEDSPAPLAEDSPTSRLEHLTHSIISYDTTYALHERRSNKADSHMSYLREYGIKGKSTGNELIDNLYKQMVLYIQKDDFPKKIELDDLKKAWEEVHPNEHFFPDDSDIFTHHRKKS